MGTTQDRIMRTYEVTLRPLSGGDPTATVHVNLSYELRDGDAVSLTGDIIDPNGIKAKAEVAKRLRKLAAMHRIAVTLDDIETNDWDIRLVRHNLVTVPCDERGRPIPKGRQ